MKVSSSVPFRRKSGIILKMIVMCNKMVNRTIATLTLMTIPNQKYPLTWMSVILEIWSAYMWYYLSSKISSEVEVHLKCELSSVLVHLAKKWTKFRSSSFGKKRELSSVQSSPRKWTQFVFQFTFETFFLFIIEVQTLKKTSSKKDVQKSETVYKTEGGKKQWEI